jgi:hypothetical protein
MGLQPIAMHLLRSLRRWMQGSRIEPGVGHPTHLRLGWKSAFQLHVASQDPAAQSAAHRNWDEFPSRRAP